MKSDASQGWEGLPVDKIEEYANMGLVAEQRRAEQDLFRNAYLSEKDPDLRAVYRRSMFDAIATAAAIEREMRGLGSGE